MVKWLLDQGAKAMARDNNGFDALWYACHRGYFGIVDLLVQRGAKVRQEESEVMMYIEEALH